MIPGIVELGASATWYFAEHEAKRKFPHNRPQDAQRRSGMTKTKRTYSIGAELIDGQTHFRVWAPKAERLEVVIDGKGHALDREASGYFSGAITAGAGT